MSRVLALVFVVVACCMALVSPAHADGEDVDLQAVDYSYQTPFSSNTAPVPASSGPDYQYGPTCGLGAEAVCYEGDPCVAEEVVGVKFDVFLEGEKVGEVCVTEQEAAEAPVVTPGRVLRAFRSLSWPASELVVQPPGGETLVNFATNFYTVDDEPLTQQVTLLGQSVLIEATPAEYTWRFGDG